MFAAALFDMDGLLLDTERLYMRTFFETGKIQNFPHPDQLSHIFSSMVGLRSKDSKQIMIDGIGAHLDVNDFDAQWDALIADELTKEVPLKPGVVTLLETLQDAGIPAAVATSTKTDKALTHLKHAGVDRFFKTVVGGDQVVNGKPNPDIYLKAAQVIGVDIAQCAAFEDSNTGIRAAVSSGALAVQVPDIVAPTHDVIALGHLIAPTLLVGARKIDLIT